MNRHCVILMLILGLACRNQAGGQSTAKGAEAGKTSKAAVATVPDYRLGADDAFSISVLNHGDLSTQVVVPPDGKINLQLLKDPITITGMTVQDLTQLLIEKYKKFLVDPYITVTLTHKRTEIVTLAGYAGTGTMEYHPNMRISEILAQKIATEQRADFSQVLLTHQYGTSKLTLDLRDLPSKVNTEVDIALQPFDTIFVPERIGKISVLGEVARPGSFEFRDDLTILDALTMAGSVKETADLFAATIVQNGKEEKIDLNAMLRNNDLSGNRKLTAGTSIMIPEIRDRVYIYGAVGRPGYFNFKQGDRILDAFNFSPPQQGAELRRVNHIRVNKTANTATVAVVNVDRILRQADMKLNVSLQPGDILFVPERKKAFNVMDIFGYLSPLGIIDNTARIFTRGLGSNRY
jgi:protein involved in polysaccharide export with SLBB domain